MSASKFKVGDKVRVRVEEVSTNPHLSLHKGDVHTITGVADGPNGTRSLIQIDHGNYWFAHRFELVEPEDKDYIVIGDGTVQTSGLTLTEAQKFIDGMSGFVSVRIVKLVETYKINVGYVKQ